MAWSLLTNGLCSFHYGCIVRNVRVQFRAQNTHDPNQEKEIGYDGHNARNFVHPIDGNIFNPATGKKRCFTDNRKKGLVLYVRRSIIRSMIQCCQLILFHFQMEFLVSNKSHNKSWQHCLAIRQCTYIFEGSSSKVALIMAYIKMMTSGRPHPMQ